MIQETKPQAQPPRMPCDDIANESDLPPEKPQASSRPLGKVEAVVARSEGNVALQLEPLGQEVQPPAPDQASGYACNLHAFQKMHKALPSYVQVRSTFIQVGDIPVQVLRCRSAPASTCCSSAPALNSPSDVEGESRHSRACCTCIRSGFDVHDDEADPMHFLQWATCFGRDFVFPNQSGIRLETCRFGVIELRESIHDGGRTKVVVKRMEMEKLENRVRNSNRKATQEKGGECGMRDIGVHHFFKRLSSEASHPNLIESLGCFIEDKFVHLVMEYCPGGDLQKVRGNQPRDFKPQFVKKCMGQVLSGVAFLHSHNVAHRDLSLENIGVKDARKSDLWLKIMDFGQAVLCRSVDGTVKHYYDLVGKLVYRDPAINLPRHDNGLAKSHVVICRPQGRTGDVVLMVTREGNPRVRLPEGNVGARVVAKQVGYEAPAADAHAMGVVHFALSYGRYPYENGSVHDDSGFSRMRLRGFRALVAGLATQPQDAMSCMEGLLRVEPQERWSVQRALAALA